MQNCALQKHLVQKPLGLLSSALPSTAEPIRIHIEDLLLVAKSRKAAPWDEEVERQFAMGIRTALLPPHLSCFQG